jgi:hypothetical protein
MLYIALEFFEWVRQFDVSNKIILYEDTFTSLKIRQLKTIPESVFIGTSHGKRRLALN